MKALRCCFVGIFPLARSHQLVLAVLALTLHLPASAADVTLLDPATLAVGTTIGEYLIVKESCPDPAKTNCQPTDKLKYVSAVPGRLGQIEFAVNLTDNFDIEVNVDWREDFDQHMIALFKADNKSESSLFVRFTYYWANQIEFNYSGRHNSSGNLGWQNGNAINNVELSATGGVASLNINRTPFKDDDGKESDTVALNSSQPYVKLVIGGIREDERLFEVKIKGGTETGTIPSSGGNFDSGKQAGIQQCKTDPASCGISMTGSGTGGVHANFNPSTGELYIPLVDVPGAFGGVQTYEVYLKQQPLKFSFDLDMNRLTLK